MKVTGRLFQKMLWTLGGLSEEALTAARTVVNLRCGQTGPPQEEGIFRPFHQGEE